MAGLSGIVARYIPTDIEVKALMEHFSDIKPDEILPYHEVERVANTRRKTARWLSVTQAWRARLLREQNIKIAAVAGIGFKRLEEYDRSKVDTKEWLDKQRQAARRTRDIGLVDTVNFSEAQKHEHTHRANIHTRVHGELVSATRELVPPKPPKPQDTLPRMAE